MARIGFVSISHDDYLDDAGKAFTQKALTELKRTGHEAVEASGIVTTHKAARETGIALASANLDGVVLFLAGWVECPVVMSFLREVEHLPLCLRGFPMFENAAGKLDSTGSYVSYAMFKGVLDRIGWKFAGVLGDIGTDVEAFDTLAAFCDAAGCRQQLKRCRIGLVGYTSMGIYPGTFDHVLMRTRIGPEIEHIDSYSMIQKAEAASPDARRSAIEAFGRAGTLSGDIPPAILDRTAGVYCGLKEWIAEHELDGINVKCQYEFSKEYRCVPCVPLSMLADEGVVASCEGDIPCTVSMMILHLLTGSTVTYGDSIHHQGNVLKLSSCGFLPFSMGAGEKKICNFLPHPGFTGIQTSFVQKPGRVTFLRLVEGIGQYTLLYGTGEGLETQLRQGIMPALDVLLDSDIRRLTERYAGQHYAICYGDLSGRIESLAKMLGISAEKI